MSVTLAWYDYVGFSGTLVVLAAFFLLQAGKMAGSSLLYQLLNAVGSAGVLVSLFGSFNLSVFVLESTWLLISAYGMARSWRARQHARR